MLLPLLSLLACGPKAPAPNGPVDLDAPLVLDPKVRTGTLDNGLRWFIEDNPFPKGRAELRLVVRAGANQEDDDQQGGAHFVEHLAFNGTRSFPGTKLVAFLESAGVDFGAHLNAYTSSDETVYQLQVPTDDPELLDTALQVLDDWAEGILFDPDEVERERGVVTEEWRSDRSAETRAYEAERRILYQGSRYAERDVIGTPETLAAMGRDDLVRFYDEWYRPELMAVMVVGPVDADVVEARIVELFSDNTNPADARPREEVALPRHDGIRVSMSTDAELSDSTVMLYETQDWRWPTTVAGVRALLVEDLVSNLLWARFDLRRQDVDAPFLDAENGDQDINRGQQFRYLWAEARVGEEAAALTGLVAEVRRAQRHGFTQQELDQVRTETLDRARSWVREADHAPSDEAIDEIVRHFLDAEWMAGTEAESALYQQLLPGVTLDEVNAEAARHFTGDSRVILVSRPAVEGSPPLTPDALRAAVAAGDASALPPWVPVVAEGELVAAPPAPGRVVETVPIAGLGGERWTLDNGATVLVVPTALARDQTLISAWSPGGLSVVDDADWFSAGLAPSAAYWSGLGPFSRAELDQYRAGRDADVNLTLNTWTEGMWAETRPGDLELALQVIWTHFADPRFDAEAMAADRARRAQRLATRLRNPDARFKDHIDAVVWGSHLRQRSWTVADLDAVDAERVEALYRERYANAADFTFAVVGDVKPKALRPLVERWVGSLPGDPSGRETWDVSTAPSPAPGPQRSVLRAGTEPKATVLLQWRIEGVDVDRRSRHHADLLGRILDQRLRLKLREELGGTYGVDVGLWLASLPTHEANVRIHFVCDPERAEELTAAARAELARLRDTPPTAAELEAVAELARRAHERRAQENWSYVSWLSAYSVRGWDLDDIHTWERSDDALFAEDSPERLHALAQRLLDDSAAFEIVRLPEEPTEPEEAPADGGGDLPAEGAPAD